ncbi:MAG: hypothetical protein R3266_02025 [Gemmatimonadota bacterium]|nr:hypothetical protein [Gemmatimonadota bacterium]
MPPLVRNVLAALGSYVALFAIIFVSFSIVWLILGPEGSFVEASWDVSGAWVAASIILGLLAAIAAGSLCARLQANRHGVHILIAIIVFMGLLSAMPGGEAAVTGPRPEDVSMFDAMSSAEQPRWILWLNPFIGIAGVLLGARWTARATAKDAV